MPLSLHSFPCMKKEEPWLWPEVRMSGRAARDVLLRSERKTGQRSFKNKKEWGGGGVPAKLKAEDYIFNCN